MMERSSGYHLPTYMMHLYRNFRSNFSRPLDTMERDADTVKSVVAKSKVLDDCSSDMDRDGNLLGAASQVSPLFIFMGVYLVK